MVEPNVSKVAEEMLGDGASAPPPPRRGRPPGKKTSAEQKRRRVNERAKARYWAKKDVVGERSPQPDAPSEPTADEIAACSFLARTTWNLTCRLWGSRALSDEEGTRLGTALAPVLQKYLPVYGDWAIEINLVLVIGGLVLSTREKRQSNSDESAGLNRLEIVEDE
jgi:hypothetical protein